MYLEEIVEDDSGGLTTPNQIKIHQRTIHQMMIRKEMKKRVACGVGLEAPKIWKNLK